MLYTFMWIAFTLFSKLFEYEVINGQNENLGIEPFCNSSFQCLMSFWSTGLFSGGTDGMTNLVSFRNNYGIFIAIFIYNLFAFIIINTIFSNIFTGLITDAFGSHREKTTLYKEDKENLCYICNLDKTDASIKGINFKSHIKKHSIHKYIEFLIYLFLKDKNELTLHEKVVRDQIINNDISWVPYNEK